MGGRSLVIDAEYRSGLASRPGRPPGGYRDGPEVVHVGSACRDIAAADPRGWRLGGGVTYSALTTARLGVRTAAIIGVDAEARGARELNFLRDAGADIMLVDLTEGPIYHNVETPTGRVQTCVQPGIALPVPALPESWVAAPAWQLAPVAGEVTDAWAAIVPDTAYVGVAWQGFLRTLIAGTRVTRRAPVASAILRRADLVGVSHHDVAPETPLEALTALLKPGARLVVTQGHEGGLVVTVGAPGPEAVLRYPSIGTDAELDPTGAGDTFLAALLSTVVHHTLGGRRADRAHPEIRLAAAAGSLVVEGMGLAGVPDRAATVARMVRDQVRRSIAPADADRVGSYEAD
jgi:sugar/nucleoside kinase (ribokinase family)